MQIKDSDMDRNKLNELLKSDFSRHFLAFENQICILNDQTAKEELGEKLYNSAYVTGRFLEIPERLWKLDELEHNQILYDPLDYIFIKSLDYLIQYLSTGYRGLPRPTNKELEFVINELKQIHQMLILP